jgi:ATP-dependent HslUV protease subunit HslV
VLAGDGQVTMNNTVVKVSARKVRRMGPGQGVMVGFAGGAADGLALFTRLESKLDEYQGNLERAVVELAKDWRTDRALRQLQALMIVADSKQSFLVNGGGDLLQPDEEEVLAIGSGATAAQAAARALLRHTELTAAEIARQAMAIAAEICVFTNDHLTVEEL